MYASPSLRIASDSRGRPRTFRVADRADGNSDAVGGRHGEVRAQQRARVRASKQPARALAQRLARTYGHRSRPIRVRSSRSAASAVRKSADVYVKQACRTVGLEVRSLDNAGGVFARCLCPQLTAVAHGDEPAAREQPCASSSELVCANVAKRRACHQGSARPPSQHETPKLPSLHDDGAHPRIATMFAGSCHVPFLHCVRPAALPYVKARRACAPACVQNKVQRDTRNGQPHWRSLSLHCTARF